MRNLVIEALRIANSCKGDDWNLFTGGHGARFDVGMLFRTRSSPVFRRSYSSGEVFGSECSRAVRGVRTRAVREVPQLVQKSSLAPTPFCSVTARRPARKAPLCLAAYLTGTRASRKPRFPYRFPGEYLKRAAARQNVPLMTQLPPRNTRVGPPSKTSSHHSQTLPCMS